MSRLQQDAVAGAQKSEQTDDSAIAGPEPIHSGHFMKSQVHNTEQASVDSSEEEDVEIDVCTNDETGATNLQQPTDTCEKPLTFYKFGPTRSKSIIIDDSLGQLRRCLTTAYEKLTTPKWKHFKGLRLNWKQRIRLNNVIWRAWHQEFGFKADNSSGAKGGSLGRVASVPSNVTLIKRNTKMASFLAAHSQSHSNLVHRPVDAPQKRYCYFVLPDDNAHQKNEGNVLEGMYWKRRTEALRAQYRRWRHFYLNHRHHPNRYVWRQNVRAQKPRSFDDGDNKATIGVNSNAARKYQTNEPRKHSRLFSTNLLQNPSNGSLNGNMSSTSTHQYQNYNEYEMDDLNNVFTDGLFDSLSRTGPYMFPDPKEIAQDVNAQFIQPGLLTLQPSLEEILRSLDDDEPFPTSHSTSNMQPHSPPNYSQPSRTQVSFYQQQATAGAQTVNGKYFPPSPQNPMPDKSRQSASSSYLTKVQSAPSSRHGSGQVAVDNDITAARILMNCSRNTFAHPTMSSQGTTTTALNSSFMPQPNITVGKPYSAYPTANYSQQPNVLYEQQVQQIMVSHEHTKKTTYTQPAAIASKGALKAYPPGKRPAAALDRAVTEQQSTTKAASNPRGRPPKNPMLQKNSIGASEKPASILAQSEGSQCQLQSVSPQLLHNIKPANGNIIFVASPFNSVDQLKSSSSSSFTPQRPIAIKPSPQQQGFASVYNTGLSTMTYVQSTSSTKLSPPKQPSATKTRRVAADSSHHELVTNPAERKKQLHLQAEQSRREALKEGFQQLITLLPNLQQANVKQTNATVLATASEKIHELKRFEASGASEIEHMRATVEQLKAKISASQSALPITTSVSTSTHHSAETESRHWLMKQFLKHVKKQSAQTPHYFLLFKILENSLQHLECAKGQNEICAIMTKWAQEQCTLGKLRPNASELLVQLVTKCPEILTQPQKLEQYLSDQIKELVPVKFLGKSYILPTSLFFGFSLIMTQVSCGVFY